MTTSSYLTVENATLALKALQAQLTALLEAGVTVAKLDSLVLSPSAGSGSGKLRYNNTTSPAKLEFSVDGGTTWLEVSPVSDKYRGITETSDSSISVAPGSFVQVNGTKSSLSVSATGMVEGKGGESWIKVEFGDTAELEAGSEALTIVDDPYPSSTNLLHIVYWGTEARLYVQDRWQEIDNG